MKVRWDRIAILLGLWAAVGTLLAFEVYFNLRVIEPSLTFFDVALPQYQRAALWVVLAPLVLWLRGCVPLGRGRWVGGIAFHFFVSGTIMATYYLARVVYLVLVGQTTWSEFWVTAGTNFWGRNLIDMLFYWLVIAGGYGAELWQRYRQEELRAAQLASRLAQAELQVLKRQLNPHFLFNAMNTISVLVREEQNGEAVRLISKLSSLLRTALDQERSSEVLLGQELDFIGQYVDIQRARFSDRLEYSAEVSPAASVARIPNLILQPLVENAIIHGAAAKAGKGTVTVKASVVRDRLVVEIADDGPGFPSEQELSARSKNGIGLSNTKERLRRIYGSSAVLAIDSRPGEGARVRLEIPYKS